MTLHVCSSGRALTALFAVVVGLLGPGCHRVVKPEAGGDRTVEAGVPVDFGAEGSGAPVVSWDFGDGSPVRSGARVSHAFEQPGTYTSRALEGGTVLASATLTVVPRPVLRAVPEDTEVLLFFPQLRGNVEPLMGFMAHLVGESQVLQSLDSIPLLSLVLREVNGEARIVEPEEGLGFFSLPRFEGSVVLLGVRNSAAALDTVLEELKARGARVVQREPPDTVRLRRDNGLPMVLFADRGYLYLVIPDAPETEPEQEGAIQKVSAEEGRDLAAEVEAVRTHIRGASATGLSEHPMLPSLRAKVGVGNVHVFARPGGDEASETIQALWAALTFQDSRADMEGWVSSHKALFEGGSSPAPELLSQAPLGPIAAMTVSLPPETLAKLAFGSPGSERRTRTEQYLARQGLDAAGVRGVLGALRGDLSLLAYLDAPAFYRNLLQGAQRPEPRGSVLFQAGLVNSAPVLEWLTGVLRSRGQPFEVKQDKGATRLLTRAFGQPVDVALTGDRLTMRGGEPLEARARGGVGPVLRERFGAEGFGAGHLSAMLDVGRVRS
ncbi:MAG: PKD domain-containing protein, partial [Cystobacter sp.]